MSTPNDIDYEGHVYGCPRVGMNTGAWPNAQCSCGFSIWNAARNRGDMAPCSSQEAVALLANWRRRNMLRFRGTTAAPSIFESGECWVAPGRSTSPGLESDAAPRATELPLAEQLAYASGWRAGRQALRQELRNALTKGENDDNHDGQ